MIPEMSENTYKIGEVASKLATSIRTIRYYEEEGLLIPVRTQRNTRLYSEKHITRLMVILRLTKLGFSIESIRNIATLREKSKTGNESSASVSMCLNEELVTINTQMEALEKLKTEIKNTLTIVNKCSGCPNKPSTKGCPDCPVVDNLGRIDLLNLVWDTE